MPLTITIPPRAVLPSYQFKLLGGVSGEVGRGIDIDNSGNIYIVGQTESAGAGSVAAFIAKYNAQGTIQWQRALGISGAQYGWNIKVDRSTGDAYIAGYGGGAAGLGSDDVFFAKYNTGGTIQWQKGWGGSNVDQEGNLTLDGSGNLYVCAYTQSDGPSNLNWMFGKFSASTGNLTWHRILGTTGIDRSYSIDVDTSGDVYICGYGGANLAVLAKYNSSGTIQWQVSLSGAGRDYFRDVKVDGNGDICVAGFFETGSGTNDYSAVVAKYDNSGTLLWQRKLGGVLSGGITGFYSLDIDSSNNIYAIGSTFEEGQGGQEILIAKYNTSGTIQWQRVLGSGLTEGGFGVVVDNNGNIFITGYTNSYGEGNNDMLWAQWPDDGTLTGVYGGSPGFVYQASTLSETVGGFTTGTSSFTPVVPTSLSVVNSSLTDQSISLTETLI